MKKMSILFALVLLISTQSVYGIPAFARRYKISCTTCHDPFPRLKAYGDDFAGNGFVLDDEEKERDYITAGDDLLWLNRDFQLAVKFEAYAITGDNTDVSNDLQAPWGMKLLSGGTLAKNIGYYFYFFMSERGEIVGLEDAYVHFNNLFGKEFDIMVGQFQTCDPLMKRELRMTFEDYVIYKQRIGNIRTNLAYDRGLIFTYGIEKTGTDLVAMVVNGNGIPDAGADKLFDDDQYKNIGLRIAQGIGENIGLGGFFYYGKEAKLDLLNQPTDVTNELMYYGPDINVAIDRFAFTAQYMIRTDSDPLFINSDDITTNGMVVELVFSPQYDRSRFYYTALYNRIDSDWDAADYHTATLSASYLLRRNIRLIGEFTHDLEQDASRFVLGITSAF
ncbi:MAG: hypothetical protein JXQ65_16010 [Candidatus Marinimicrobia bacterium]|nr:hypothetical protein [Candidatus Neomarinimicrobiota bacterium]